MNIPALAGHLHHLDRRTVVGSRAIETMIAHGSGTLGKVGATLAKIRAFGAGAERSRPGELGHRLATFVRNHPRATAALCLGVGLVAGALLCIATGPLGVFVGAVAGMVGFLALRGAAGRSTAHASSHDPLQRTHESPPLPLSGPSTFAIGDAENLEIIFPSPSEMGGRNQRHLSEGGLRGVGRNQSGPIAS